MTAYFDGFDVEDLWAAHLEEQGYTTHVVSPAVSYEWDGNQRKQVTNVDLHKEFDIHGIHRAKGFVRLSQVTRNASEIKDKKESIKAWAKREDISLRHDHLQIEFVFWNGTHYTKCRLTVGYAFTDPEPVHIDNPKRLIHKHDTSLG